MRKAVERMIRGYSNLRIELAPARMVLTNEQGDDLKRMIKLNRGECPEELTDEVCAELTRLYLEDKSKDVWNSPKIKKPLKKALLEMSHDKCAYCECMLGIESKDVTIDHFLPKSVNGDKVVEWENLLPSCLRCNRNKNASEDLIVNPCLDKPGDYLALCLYDYGSFENICAQKRLLCCNIGKRTRLQRNQPYFWVVLHTDANFSGTEK